MVSSYFFVITDVSQFLRGLYFTDKTTVSRSHMTRQGVAVL